MSVPTNSPPRRFRLRALRIFLTYPRCPLEPQVLLDHVKSLEIPPLLEYIVAREPHSDGGLHLHAFLRFETPLECIDPAFFDFSGYHPNIQSVRSSRAVRRYVQKGGEFISSLDIESVRPSWGDLIQLPTREEFLAQV